MDGRDPLIGAVLGGTYRIDQRLGAGGMGAVFAATHLRTGRAVAVKVLLPEVAARRGAMERFRREAEAVGALGHANIVAIHDFDQEGGRAWLVMDRLEGEELAARLERRGPMPLEEATPIFEQIAAGLGAAHARGLLHRDLKPANVFLARMPGAPERAVILDFGLARSLEEDGAERLTANGVVVGTPQYLSPEQATGAPLDARADLYALATLFYEMLAGVTPFSAPTLPALLLKVAAEPPPPLTRHRPDLPPALAEVLERALAKSPGERFPDAASLVAAVRAASAALPPTAAERVITGPVSPSEVPRHFAGGVPAGHAVVGHTPISHPPTASPIDPRAATAAAPQVSPRGAWPWIVAALALLGAITAGVAIAIVAVSPEPPAEQRAAVAPARLPPEPTAAEPRLDPALMEIEAVPEPAEVIAPVAEPEPPAPIARRPRRARELAPSSAPPVAPPSSVPAPSAGGPPAGVQDAVAHMGRSDWRGCIRAARAAPRSPEILGARMSCALRAEDHDELRATCRELRTHYPSHPQTQSCASILRGYGLEL